MDPTTIPDVATASVDIDAFQQRAVALAGDHALDLEYLTTALCEEAGEVCGVVKKRVFHRRPDVGPEAMLGELGDVLWTVAMLAEARGWKLSYLLGAVRFAYVLPIHCLANEPATARGLAHAASDVGNDPYGFDKALLIGVVGHIVFMTSLYHYTLADVARANVAKVAARYPHGFTVEAAMARRDQTSGSR